MKEPEYKTAKENYQDALVELQNATTAELERLADNNAFHGWFRRAAKDVLKKRQTGSDE